MSHRGAVRKLRLPPENFAVRKFPKTRCSGRSWYRVHPTGVKAGHFSLNPTHRFSHEDSPYPLLYLASDIETCLFERFGDSAYDRERSISQWLLVTHSVSAVLAPELYVCDLTQPKTLSSLMVDLTALMHNDLSTPQKWGLALQSHPAHVQGIKFASRFNGKPCLALFQRDNIEETLVEKLLGPLTALDAAVDWLDKHRIALY
jgi:hypothetical protein